MYIAVSSLLCVIGSLRVYVCKTCNQFIVCRNVMLCKILWPIFQYNRWSLFIDKDFALDIFSTKLSPYQRFSLHHADPIQTINVFFNYKTCRNYFFQRSAMFSFFGGLVGLGLKSDGKFWILSRSAFMETHCCHVCLYVANCWFFRSCLGKVQ